MGLMALDGGLMAVEDGNLHGAHVPHLGVLPARCGSAHTQPASCRQVASRLPL